MSFSKLKFFARVSILPPMVFLECIAGFAVWRFRKDVGIALLAAAAVAVFVCDMAVYSQWVRYLIATYLWRYEPEKKQKVAVASEGNVQQFIEECESYWHHHSQHRVRRILPFLLGFTVILGWLYLWTGSSLFFFQELDLLPSIDRVDLSALLGTALIVGLTYVLSKDDVGEQIARYLGAIVILIEVLALMGIDSLFRKDEILGLEPEIRHLITIITIAVLQCIYDFMTLQKTTQGNQKGHLGLTLYISMSGLVSLLLAALGCWLVVGDELSTTEAAVFLAGSIETQFVQSVMLMVLISFRPQGRPSPTPDGPKEGYAHAAGK